MTASRVWWLPSLLAFVLVLTACSDDSTSATDEACAAKDHLSDSIQTVVDDVKAGNFGDARDDLDVVRARAADLRTAVSDLARKKRERLQPQADKLKDDLNQLRGATGLDDLRTGFASVAASASALVSQLENDLGCQS